MPRKSANDLLTPRAARDRPKMDVPYDFDERKGRGPGPNEKVLKQNLPTLRGINAPERRAKCVA